MRRLSICMIVGVLATCAEVKFAQAHTDVQFSYVDGKIDFAPSPGTTNFVFESFFPTFGIERQFATLPGFASEAINGLGIGPNDQIFYDVLDDLLYWDGTSVTAPPQDHSIRVRHFPSSVLPDTIIDGDSGEQLGDEATFTNRVGAASGSGEFHTDLQWCLGCLVPEPFPQATPYENVGAYGVKLRLTTDADGIAPSDPFIFAFNFGLTNTGFDQAVDAFTELLSDSLDGDFDGDGDVDGDDFLRWQRGSPPDPPSTQDLSDWQSNYGAPNPLGQQLALTVPEPGAVLLSLLGVALLLGTQRGHRFFP